MERNKIIRMANNNYKNNNNNHNNFNEVFVESLLTGFLVLSIILISMFVGRYKLYITKEFIINMSLIYFEYGIVLYILFEKIFTIRALKYTALMNNYILLINMIILYRNNV
jgi:glycosyltransferase involved in cell wall biosynthesis